MPGVGLPPLEANCPPVVLRNYGRWVNHEQVRPGVLKHVAEGGEACYTVRAGMPTNARVSTALARQLADLAEEFAGGSLRLTRRHSLELVGVDPARIDALIERLEALGLPVGGTGRTFRNTVSCTGWLHCQFAATDAPGIAKAVADELYEDFLTERYPAMLKVSVSGCVNQCGEGSTADIGIIGIHRDLPRVVDEEVARCEIPLIVSVCPTGAIRPKPPKSVQVDPERCIHCVACAAQCHGMQIGDPETDGVAVVVGGKAGNSGAGPAFAKFVVPYLPNSPPRWPEVTATVRQIVEAWVRGARRDERIGDWIARIGWGVFFRKTGLPLSDKVLDGYVLWPMAARTGVRFHW